MAVFMMKLPRTGSLEERTIVGETCAKSVQRLWIAYVSQREHRTIALEEREVPIKKLLLQVLYGRLCRSP
jgi:hypothetical protein